MQVSTLLLKWDAIRSASGILQQWQMSLEHLRFRDHFPHPGIDSWKIPPANCLFQECQLNTKLGHAFLLKLESSPPLEELGDLWCSPDDLATVFLNWILIVNPYSWPIHCWRDRRFYLSYRRLMWSLDSLNDQVLWTVSVSRTPSQPDRLASFMRTIQVYGIKDLPNPSAWLVSHLASDIRP